MLVENILISTFVALVVDASLLLIHQIHTSIDMSTMLNLYYFLMTEQNINKAVNSMAQTQNHPSYNKTPSVALHTSTHRS
jgi:hypothetical protein